MTEKDEIFSELDQFGEIVDKVFYENITLDFDLTKYKFENQRQLIFKKVTFKGSFTFMNFNSNLLESIEFEDCSFYKNVVFKSISAQNILFEISNSVFHRKFQHRFTDFKVNIFQFDKNEIEYCYLHNIVSSDLIINNCPIKNRLSLYDIECDFADIIYDEDKLCNRIIINSPKIKEISIKSKDNVQSIYLSEIQTAYIYGAFDRIDINSTDFSSIQITELFENDNSKKYSKIGEINFQEANFQGLLAIEDLEINKLVFSGLNMTNGSVRFNEITIKDTRIYDCTISNFYWNQVKFINAPDITRSDLSELKMANVFWQNNKRLKHSFLDDKIPILYGLRKKWLEKSKKDINNVNISELKYQIETYRQLKAASISNHNPIEGLTFYRNEMKLYWKLIRIEGGIPWYDRFLIFINRWSSDFGQNWFLPLLWISITTSIFYFTVEQPTLSYYPIDIGNGILEVLYYVNPIRKVDENLPKAAQGLDVLLRAVNAYFIYHFIKASRKFGKI